MERSLWYKKYQPRVFTELLYSDDTHLKLFQEMKNYRQDIIIQIIGNSGSGKTLTTNLISKQLKYNVLEVNETNIQSIQEAIKGSLRTLNNIKTILFIEDDGYSNINNVLGGLKQTHIPIVLTNSRQHLKLKYIQENLKTYELAENNVSILFKILNKIVKSEKLSIDNNTLLKIIELGSGDIRKIINIIQLISKVSLNTNTLDKLENLVKGNIFHTCNKIMNGRLNMHELFSVYTPQIGRLCIKSSISQLQDWNKLSSMVNNISDGNIFPRDYEFLSLHTISKCCMDFNYKKDPEPYEDSWIKGINNPRWYFRYYKRNLYVDSMRKIFKNIVDFYNITNLSKEDENMLSYQPNIVEKDRRIFRYKKHKGLLNAIKRDISMDEFLYGN